MKQLLITIAALVLVGCGEKQQSFTAPKAKPVEPVVEVSKPEPPTVPVPAISIHLAAEQGNVEALKQILSAGTNVNAKTGDGSTPLHKAENKEVAKLLITAGADVNAKDLDSWTPLHTAVFTGDRETVELLVSNGADVNAKDSDVMTVLHYAALFGHIEIAEFLIANGADLEAEDETSGTPLLTAVCGKKKELVELLIAKGANVNPRNDNDKLIKPLDWAIAYRQSELADLLRKHGAKTAEELKSEGK